MPTGRSLSCCFWTRYSSVAPPSQLNNHARGDINRSESEEIVGAAFPRINKWLRNTSPWKNFKDPDRFCTDQRALSCPPDVLRSSSCHVPQAVLNGAFFLPRGDILQAFSPLQQLQPHCNNKNRGVGQASSPRSLSKQVLRLQVLWIMCTVVPVYVTPFWFRLLAKSLAANQCYCFKQWSNFSTAPEPSITHSASKYYGFLIFTNIADVAGATQIRAPWVSCLWNIRDRRWKRRVHTGKMLHIWIAVSVCGAFEDAVVCAATIYPKDTPEILPLAMVEAPQLAPPSPLNGREILRTCFPSARKYQKTGIQTFLGTLWIPPLEDRQTGICTNPGQFLLRLFSPMTGLWGNNQL